MLRLKRYRILVIFVLLSACFIACKKNNAYLQYQPVSTYDGTIYSYLQTHPSDFNYLLFVLDRAGLTKMLQQDTITFFAPTDNSLMAAMEEYNTYRLVHGKQPATLNDIDSSSWRSILEPYIVRGKVSLNDFGGQDGLMMTTIARRPMHGQLVKHNASGVNESGSETIKFSYLNGSRFTADWISTYVVTSNLVAKNGIIHVLENRHVLGFNYFIYKAKQPQNPYSESRTFSNGTITASNGISDLWGHYIKELKAVDSNTVELEASSYIVVGQLGYLMRLTVHDNDSVTVSSAPNSVNATIQNDGPCFFDPANFLFKLNYSYVDNNGKHAVNEIVRYIATGSNTY